MIKAALAKPIAVIVALLGIVVFSVLALGRIPVDIIPPGSTYPPSTSPSPTAA